MGGVILLGVIFLWWVGLGGFRGGVSSLGSSCWLVGLGSDFIIRLVILLLVGWLLIYGFYFWYLVLGDFIRFYEEIELSI